MERKEYIRSIFDKSAAHYGEKGCSWFDYFGKQLVILANPSKGAKVLDVAMGKGAVLFSAANAIGTQGSAIGIDISSQMIQESEKKALAYSQVQLLQMDAENLIFPGHSFDIVFCAFALFFFPNIQRALSEFKRVLKPNGCLAVSVWGKKHSLSVWLSKRAQELGATHRLQTVVLDNPELLQEQLKTCFSQVEIKEETKTFTFTSAEEWFDSLWTHGTRSLLEQLTSENLSILRKEALHQAALSKMNAEQHVIYGLCHF